VCEIWIFLYTGPRVKSGLRGQARPWHPASGRGQMPCFTQMWPSTQCHVSLRCGLRPSTASTWVHMYLLSFVIIGHRSLGLINSSESLIRCRFIWFLLSCDNTLSICIKTLFSCACTNVRVYGRFQKFKFQQKMHKTGDGIFFNPANQFPKILSRIESYIS